MRILQSASRCPERKRYRHNSRSRHLFLPLSPSYLHSQTILSGPSS